MISLSFPKVFGELVNLRELTMDDATTIVNLMDYDITKYLYEVPYPYRIDDSLKFIKSSYNDFKLRKAITFGIEYKDILELEEISAYVFPGNNSSIRVLEKNRFGKTGEVNEYHPLSQRCRNSLIYTIKNKNYTFH